MQIYMRKRNASGSWEDTVDVSNEPYQQSNDAFGHPSICVLEENDTTWLYVAYVDERGYGNNYRELRGNIFDGEYWGTSDFISNEAGYELPFASGGGWSTNLVVTADKEVYAFWVYWDSESNGRLYFNSTTGSWNPSNETLLYTDTDTTHSSIHMNPYADPDSNIHLVYADLNGDDPYEIYYLCKGPSDNNFGNYPGTQVSSDSDSSNVHSEFPSCAYSEYNDTAYVHVVWSHDPLDDIYYRRLNLTTDTWTNIEIVDSPSTGKETRPSITVDSFGDVHVVWERDDDVDEYVTQYRKYTASTGQWGSITTLDGPDCVDDYGLPIIVADVYDNLHLLMTGIKIGSTPPDEDVFHYFYDAPPHIWDLTFLQNQSNQDSVVIDWEGMNEPDLNTYKVYRKLEDGQWEHIGSTTDTRYADTTASYFIICGDDDITKYYVEAVDDAAQSAYSDTLEIWCIENGKIYAGNMAELIDLGDNYPNPFNARTTIEYNVPYDMAITLEIYDILGRKVETLIDDFQSPGSHAVIWDASHIASGMYFYRFQAGDYSAARRMTILK